MNKKMQLVLDIMKLGVEISKNTTTDVFVEYSGHVDLLCVRICAGGWEKSKDEESYFYKNIYLNANGYRTEEDIVEVLEEIYAELVNIS